MVRKKNGKWRMCMDFTDLNKCCPKNNFPLLRINKIVDFTAGCEVLALLDCFSGYHQICLIKRMKSRPTSSPPSELFAISECPKASAMPSQHSAE
jgi:hypothetical protein